MINIEKGTATGLAFYVQLAEQTRHLLLGESDYIANLANVSALLNEMLEDLNWTGFYLRKGTELILGPFQGKPACVRIALGKGVCGTAAQTDTPQVVPDVFMFPGHIACDAASRSELVIPIHAEGKVVAVLDMDSPSVGRFAQSDLEGLLLLVAVIESGTDFSPLLNR